MTPEPESHRAADVLAVLALGLALASVVCVLLGAWDAGAWLGLAGGLVATYDELVARTSVERGVILVAFLLALVGVAVSMAHGGLLGVAAAP